MTTIETFTKHNRMPLAYSNLPDMPDTTEPVCAVGDEVVTNGPWSIPQTCKVLEVSANHCTVWVDVPGPGGDRTAIGVHRIETISRGSDRWVRSAVRS